jgi:hypothetical protein
MAATDYWKECIEIAANDCGLVLTPDQLQALAWAVESGHENYGQAFYSPPAGEYTDMRVANLQRELATERAKIVCKECKGTGRTVENFYNRSSSSPCWKCNGDGRHLP